ncbi:unnamed protein product [Ectocarpus sp. CCAP 1310/34]|nr:unnamed protein product [Ectocarpus sp. CCAP 1310/34]
MASIVKFKFKSAREYDSVSFPGTGIKLLDLKRAIVEQKKLHQGMEFDLNIVNDKTREVQRRQRGRDEEYLRDSEESACAQVGWSAVQDQGPRRRRRSTRYCYCYHHHLYQVWFIARR